MRWRLRSWLPLVPLFGQLLLPIPSRLLECSEQFAHGSNHTLATRAISKIGAAIDPPTAECFVRTVTQGAADALPWADLLPPFRRPAVRGTTVSSNKDMGHDQLEKSAAGCLDAFRDSKTTP